MTHQEAEQLLGVSVEAAPEEIRAAYLRQVKEHPPDRDPERFELIRDAYDKLRDPRARARVLLFGNGPEMPFEQLVPKQSRRAFVGPEPWREAFRKDG